MENTRFTKASKPVTCLQKKVIIAVLNILKQLGQFLIVKLPSSLFVLYFLTTPLSDHSLLMDLYRSGYYTVLCNANIISEGITLPLIKSSLVLAIPTSILCFFLCSAMAIFSCSLLVGIVTHTIRGTNMKKEVFIAEFVKKYGSLPPERILKENNINTRMIKLLHGNLGNYYINLGYIYFLCYVYNTCIYYSSGFHPIFNLSFIVLFLFF